MELIQPIEAAQLLDEAISTVRKWETPLGKAKKGKAEEAFEALRNGQIRLDNPQAHIQRMRLEDFELEGLQLLPEMKKSLLAENGYALYLLTLPVMLFPGRKAQYQLMESHFSLDAEQDRHPLAIRNTFPTSSWQALFDWGGRFRLALNENLDWGIEVLQTTVKKHPSGAGDSNDNSRVKLAGKIEAIQHNLDAGGYTIVAKECAGLIEYGLQQSLTQYLPRLKTEDQERVKELQRRMSKRGPLTMGGLMKLLRDSQFFDTLARTCQKDLGQFRAIDLNQVRLLRNKLIHKYQEEATQAEAEFLLKGVRVIFETFELDQDLLLPDLDEKPLQIPKLDDQLTNFVDRQNRLRGFMGVTPPFEHNLGRMEITTAFGPSTAAWRLDSAKTIRSQGNMPFVIVTKVPKAVTQITIEAAAQAEPSFTWLTAQVSQVFDRLPQAIQQIIRGRKGLPLQDFQTWTLDLPQ